MSIILVADASIVGFVPGLKDEAYLVVLSLKDFRVSSECMYALVCWLSGAPVRVVRHRCFQL